MAIKTFPHKSTRSPGFPGTRHQTIFSCKYLVKREDLRDDIGG